MVDRLRALKAAQIADRILADPEFRRRTNGLGIKHVELGRLKSDPTP